MIPFDFSERPYLVCKDHTVSGEYFELRREENFQLLATFPKPSLQELPDFYKSEEYISHTDSRKTLRDKTYQAVKSYMLRKKLHWIEKQVGSKGKILDVGAGTGDFLLTAKRRGWNVFGQEPNSEARSLSAAKGISLVEETSNIPDHSMDVITLWHVLEHVSNLDKQIKELDRLLKADGLLVIAVPNYKSYDAKIYREHWAAYDVPRHLYHFSRTSVKAIFSEYSFRLFAEKGLSFDSFYVSLLSEKNKTGRSNPAKAFINGLLSNFKAKGSGEHSSIAYFLRKA